MHTSVEDVNTDLWCEMQTTWDLDSIPGAIPGHFLVSLPMQRKLRTMTTVDKLMEIISEDLQGLCLGFDVEHRHHVWEPVRNLLEDSDY